MSSDVYYASNRFLHGSMQAGDRLGTAVAMPATFKTGMAASLHNGKVHIVRSAAIVTDGTSSRIAARWMCGNGSANVRAALADEVACDWCERMQHLPDGPVVYRMFNLDDELIYIGSTVNLGVRLRSHAAQTPWWDQVAYYEGERFETIDAARYAESVAIARESPTLNRVGKTLRVIEGSAA